MRYVPEKRNLGGRGLTLYLAGDDGRARAVAVIEYLQNISRISPEYLGGPRQNRQGWHGYPACYAATSDCPACSGMGVHLAVEYAASIRC